MKAHPHIAAILIAIAIGWVSPSRAQSRVSPGPNEPSTGGQINLDRPAPAEILRAPAPAAPELAPVAPDTSSSPVRPPEAGDTPTEHLKIDRGRIEKKIGDSWSLAGLANLGNVIKALEDLYPTDTISIDPRLREAPLQDLKLRASSVMGDLEALRVASGDLFTISNASSEVYTLEPSAEFKEEASLARTNGSPDVDVMAFNLGPYLSTLTINSKGDVDRAISSVKGLIEDAGAMLSASRTRLGILDPGAKPSVVYYPDAKLLVVCGTSKVLNAASKIVNALPTQRATAAPPALTPEQLEMMTAAASTPSTATAPSAAVPSVPAPAAPVLPKPLPDASPLPTGPLPVFQLPPGTGKAVRRPTVPRGPDGLPGMPVDLPPDAGAGVNSTGASAAPAK